MTRVFAILFVLLAPALAEGANPVRAGGSWIDIVSKCGPVGIAEVGKYMTVCGDVRLGSQATELIPEPGEGVIASVSQQHLEDVHNLVTKETFGDCELQLEFLMAKNSNSGVKMQHRYEIQLYDSHDVENPTARHCGGIYPHWLFQGEGKPLKYIDKGVPPRLNAAKPAGEWQTLHIVFRAPRFDLSGEKTENARFVLVKLNGKTIHENVELDSPTGNASTPLPEVAKAEVMFQLDHGAVAFRKIRLRPLKL